MVNFKTKIAKISWPKISLAKIFNDIRQTFSRDGLKSVKHVPKTLSSIDKVVISILTLVIIFGGVLIWYRQWLTKTKELPAFGGVYIEGIIGEPKDLDKHAARLTNIGLTRIQPDGTIVGDIASKWDILNDGKTYQFTLKPDFNSYDLAAFIQSKGIWPNIEIETPSPETINFKFKQPFSPFLYTSTQPIFPYGPYKIVREEKTKITFQAREDYFNGKAHISKIVLNLYPDSESLGKAIGRGEIDGYLKQDKNDPQKANFTTFEMALPRETLLFFNLTKTDLQDVNIRKKLRDNQALDKELNLTLITSDRAKNMQTAQELKDKWKKLNVNITIKQMSNAQLQKDFIPTRNYDLLLYGLDYGPDPDPYPFWHSSQATATGMNLSNYSNKRADKLLEDARQTFDQKAREDKYAQFRQILADDVPYILMEKESLFYNVTNTVKGITKIYGVSETDRFMNVDNWFISVKRVGK